MTDIVIVTFATNGGEFRNYSNRVKKFSENCQSLNLKLEVYTPERLLQSQFYRFHNKYFDLKRGAGYWHWKPVVLMDAHAVHPNSVLIYVDVDFDLISVPFTEIETLIRKEKSICIFKCNDFLLNWASKRFMRKLEISNSDRMCIASIVICNFSSSETLKHLQTWIELNDDPDLLLDPIFAFDSRHRHDQTILSYLANREIDSFQLMEQGYWAESIEAQGFDKVQAWVVSAAVNGLMTTKNDFFGLGKLKYFLWIIKNRIELFWFSHGF